MRRAATARGLPSGEAATPGAGAAGRGGRRHRKLGSASVIEALLWLGPALILIFVIVIYPAVTLVVTSFGRFSIIGLRQGLSLIHI